MTSHSLYANEDIESIKKTIISTLTHANQSALAPFQILSQQYEQLVTNFFDKQNHESLKKHVSHMEKYLNVLLNVIKDPQFISVRANLVALYPHISELVTMFKNSLGSKNYVSLGWKVRSFKFLLPDSIKKMGDLSLFWCLRHRILS